MRVGTHGYVAVSFWRGGWPTRRRRSGDDCPVPPGRRSHARTTGRARIERSWWVRDPDSNRCELSLRLGAMDSCVCGLLIFRAFSPRSWVHRARGWTAATEPSRWAFEAADPPVAAAQARQARAWAAHPTQPPPCLLDLESTGLRHVTYTRVCRYSNLRAAWQMHFAMWWGRPHRRPR
jgi:hypothetical protein